MSTPRDPRGTQSNMSTPRDPRGPQSDMSMSRDIGRAHSEMSTPRDTCGPLSDITNVTDEASRKRDQRNMQQRKRRADMSIEQREEINRKQREYRQRKKAATQNSSTSATLTETMSLTSLTMDIDENADPCDENTPIILGNNNIQKDADGNQSHVGVGTSTTRGSAQSEVNDNDVLDSADTRREEKNARQRKRRDDMTDQQREEINRKQREYRARRKVAMQNITTTSDVSQIVPASSPTGE
ncbi:uncharacterized protein LOC110431423 [Sorghum bicolor]|uniref:uncharacterized protein LOC110431423 n=1 Tax=Sorghum bicolor TaxID=4558 RepID=UPI000B426197|nr:uncharacterized protein LOC110431423 [Sorghum bicolor]|eukprot:XP_021306215.1 uncharacterized protein LOC110431423 [Sorghum bicolor]